MPSPEMSMPGAFNHKKVMGRSKTGQEAVAKIQARDDVGVDHSDEK